MVFLLRNASGTAGPNQPNVKGYFIYRVVRTQGLDFLSLSESFKALRIRPFLSRSLASNRPFLELNLGLIYLNLVLTIFTQTGFIFRLLCTTTKFYNFSIE